MPIPSDHLCSFSKNQLLPPLAVKINQGPVHASVVTKRGAVGDGGAWGAPARAFVPQAQPAWLISSREKTLRPGVALKASYLIKSNYYLE